MTAMKRFRIGMAAMILSGLGLVAPALAQGYNVRPGDVLKIEVVQDPSMNRAVLVAPDGRISMPLAGSVQAAGRSVEAIAGALATGLGPQFAAAPDVFVSLERLADRITGGPGAGKALGQTIHVMGAATKPGKYEVARNTTVLQLFAEMGGFDKFAAKKRVQLRRGDKIYLVNYAEVEAGTSTMGNMVLQPGDVIVIPQRRLFE
jgi:polysaccharide export outer membrane protein